ncbi:MBL fold metallo-hydrolase [Streptomyces himalayensis]|uniref:MBL fold metallo-hydrolase n=1 Tax=Streptomyces himalayensis subsp. himalayensis TaxID=2756131 RepID=A0A7W0DSG6_9ACTN|nr:MBL fold metallo-hydrolase [Streptomyces himalayensis]MBA2950456.1 MBL fold metallo-hydrolase [Streptomyces himalayensis subsp. himalayensis]
MTSSPRHEGMTGCLTRRRFGQLAALGLVAGVGSVGPISSAVAAGADARVHYDRARRLAGSDPVLRALVAALTPGFDFPRPPAPAPIKLFDNLAMLSVGWVSAMAVLTDDGIVMIDALTSPAEAESVLVPGLRELGADPETIRYVVVTHGHGDHFGGAQYLADHYGARVLMSPADWDLVARTRPANAPTRDLDIADGQRLTLGGTTIQLHHTPGHTPGTVSPIIPVRAGRERHTAMLWGGTNPLTTPTELRTYLGSIHSFRARMRQANVDVELSNHPGDYGLQRAEQLRSRPGRANPFVLGRPRTQRFMAVMESMLRGRLADAEAGNARGASRSHGGAVQGCC